MSVTDELFERNRVKMLDAFDPYTGAYSHVTPYKQTHFIDGMAWVSLVAGAAHRFGDTEVEKKCSQFLNILTTLSATHYNDPLSLRAFGPTDISGRWVQHGKYWVLRKPQAFAGPAAYNWARKQGCALGYDVDTPWTASLFTNGLFAWMFGHATKFISGLEQHMNSVMLAHLLKDDRPPKSMRWMAENNPFWSIITGDDFYTSNFPPMTDMQGGRTIDKGEPTEFHQRDPGPWPGKNHPHKMYQYDIPPAPAGDEYTPACWLFCYYMRSAK